MCCCNNSTRCSTCNKQKEYACGWYKENVYPTCNNNYVYHNLVQIYPACSMCNLNSTQSSMQTSMCYRKY